MLEPDIIPIPSPDPISGIIVGVIGIIGGILGNTGADLQALENTVKSLGNAIGEGLSAVADALNELFGHGLIDLLRRIWDGIKALAAHLKQWLLDLRRIIQWVRDVHQWLFSTYLAPILNALQHLRQVLAIFRVFHLKFAQTLDNTIADIEGKIGQHFALVWTTLNQVLSWAQLITGLDGLLQPGLLWGSIFRDFSILGALLHITNVAPITGPAQAATVADQRYFTPPWIASEQSHFAANGQSSDFSDLRSQVRQGMSEL